MLYYCTKPKKLEKHIMLQACNLRNRKLNAHSRNSLEFMTSQTLPQSMYGVIYLFFIWLERICFLRSSTLLYGN